MLRGLDRGRVHPRVDLDDEVADFEGAPPGGGAFRDRRLHALKVHLAGTRVDLAIGRGIVSELGISIRNQHPEFGASALLSGMRRFMSRLEFPVERPKLRPGKRFRRNWRDPAMSPSLPRTWSVFRPLHGTQLRMRRPPCGATR